MRPTAFSHSTTAIRRRRGFTLLEVLITVGILVLLVGLTLAGVLAAKKKATETRIRSDLGLIETALTAYHDEFGDYPRFADPSADYNTRMIPSATGKEMWLDYSQYRGAVLLCRALIGPDVANTDTANPLAAYPGDDGSDGPGFRTRRNYNTNTKQFSGKVYGPYLDASKFKMSLIQINQTLSASDYVLLDINGNPILYYPAAVGPANISSSEGFDYDVDPNTYASGGTPLPVPLYNAYDNNALMPAATFQLLMGDTNQNGQIDTTTTPPEQAATSLPYLLWTSGADGIFGFAPNQSKSDDITNFDLPANLKK